MNSLIAQAIDNLMPGNQLFGVGTSLMYAINSVAQLGGSRFWLDPTNGDDGNDGKSPDKAFKTLPIAYAELTAGKNDILYVIGGSSALNLASAFTWSKSYTHLIGLASDMTFGGRVRIGHNANFTTLFTIDAAGCIFENIHWQMGRGSATNLNTVVLSATAHYNYFHNCHFDGPLNATEGGGTQAWRNLVLTGSVSTGCRSLTFKKCTFGDWTVVCASANGTHVEFQGIHAGTHFEDCTFITNTSSSSMVPIKSDVNLGGGYAYIQFKGCRFINTNTATSVVFGTPTMGYILIDDCRSFRHTAWAGATNQIIIANSFTGDDAAGLGVVHS